MSWINQPAFSRKAGKIGLGVAVLIAMAGAVGAQERYPAAADQHDGASQSPNQSLAPSRADRAAFGRSGTRGREGLGENPAEPEGPGNVAN